MRALDELRRLGYRIQLDGENIICRFIGPGKPDRERVVPLLQELKAGKAEAVAQLRREAAEGRNSRPFLQANRHEPSPWLYWIPWNACSGSRRKRGCWVCIPRRSGCGRRKARSSRSAPGGKPDAIRIRVLGGVLARLWRGRPRPRRQQDRKSIHEELVHDLLAIVTSFSGKLYGLRSHQRARALVEAVRGHVQEQA